MVADLLLSLIYELNFVIDILVKEKHMFGAIHGFRNLLGLLEHTPKGKVALLYLNDLYLVAQQTMLKGMQG
jgi:hypothetical protein